MLLLCILPLIALLLSFAISTSTDVLKSAAKHGSVVGNQRESTTAEEVKLYKGYKLVRINPSNEEALRWLVSLYSGDMSNIADDLDFWQPPTRINALVDVTISPSDYQWFFGELRRRGIKFAVILDDLETAIQNEKHTLNGSSFSGVSYNEQNYKETKLDEPFYTSEKEGFWNDYRYDRYNPLSKIEAQLYRLRDRNPKLVSLFDIGKTHENRSIIVAKVSARDRTGTSSAEEDQEETEGPAIWIDAGIHAREFIAPATAMLILSRIISGYKSNDPNIRYLVENLDWYINVMANPDGYEYAQTKNRMWRKNRRKASCKQTYFNKICCSGVDLNRNFDWFWGSTGASADPCHETYHGPAAFSEPESRAIKDFLQEHKEVKAFVTFHSYSQLWLIPYGHKKRNYPEDYAKILNFLAAAFTQGYKCTEKAIWHRISSGEWGGPFVRGFWRLSRLREGNIPLSFLVELRPQNTLQSTGFLLPEAEITDTGEETWEAIKVIADEVLDRYGPDPKRRKPQVTESMTTTTESTTISMVVTSQASTTVATTLSPDRFSSSTINTRVNPTTTEPIVILPFMPVRTRIIPTQKKHTFLPNPITSSTSATTTKSIELGTKEPAPCTLRLRTLLRTLMGNRKKTSSKIGVPSIVEERRKKGILIKISTMTSVTAQPPLIEGQGIEIQPQSPRRTIRCADFTPYCKWWRMQNLCKNERVRKTCHLSCLRECQI